MDCPDPSPPVSPAPSSVAAAPAGDLAEDESSMSDFFAGPEGIRPGWRLAFYLAMSLGMLFAFRWLLADWQPQGKAALWADLFEQLAALLSAFIPGFVMARVEHRRFGDYGFPWKNAFDRNFWVGSAWGIASVSLLVLVLRGLHGFYFGHLALHGGRVVRFALFWGAFFLLVGFFEEFFARGYTQFTLTQGIGFWPAALALSAIFGAVHLNNSGENLAGAAGAAFIGLFFCLTLRRTGTLWFAVGMHTSWDWAESFVYSVPDSGGMVPGHLLKSTLRGPVWLTGGSVGPEGSLLVFILIAVLWLCFDYMYPEVRYPAARALVPHELSRESSLDLLGPSASS